jgi:hypothetical protein
MTVETYTAAAFWSSYLVNGDASGLDEMELELASEWRARNGFPNIVATDGEPRFSPAFGAITGWDAYNVTSGQLLDFVALS